MGFDTEAFLQYLVSIGVLKNEKDVEFILENDLLSPIILGALIELEERLRNNQATLKRIEDVISYDKKRLKKYSGN